MAQSPKPSQSPRFKTLFAEQKGLCALCGQPMPASRAAVAHATLWKKWRPTIDHIRPRSKGGSDAADNLQLAHAQCNRRKGNHWQA